MKYRNQNDYPNTIYITNTDHPEDEEGKHTTIKDSGCGLCTAVMLVDSFYPGIAFDIDEAIKLAYEVNANHTPGTDYNRYTKALCDKFNLSVSRSDKKEDFLNCLNNGGLVIFNSGGDHDDHIGVFSHFGHFLIADKVIDGHLIRIADPGYRDGKYLEGDRPQKIKVSGNYIYADIDTVMSDTQNRKYPIYMFYKNAK